MEDSSANIAYAWVRTKKAKMKPMTMVRSNKPYYDVKEVDVVATVSEKP